MKAVKSYRSQLIEALQDPDEAARYLNAALEDGDQKVFLLALRDVAEAQGGMVRLARLAKRNREALYRTLSRRGNPEFLGLGKLLGAMGFRLAVVAKQATRAHPGAAA